MRVLVCGLGALGTVYATFLKAAGHRVFGLVKDRHRADRGDCRLRVTGIWGEKEAVLDGVTTDPLMFSGERFDIIILTVKSYDTVAAAAQLVPVVGPETLVIAAQNGYGNYEALSQKIGREHTLLARVIFGSRLLGPGCAEVTVIADDVRMGQPEGAVAEDRIITVVNTLNSAGIPTSYAPDVSAILWDKILYNCALNPLGAILGCNYGALADHPETRRIMDCVIAEIFAVAGACGIRLNWNDCGEYRDHFYKRLLPPTRDHFPSMYHDLQAGKRLEIEALNGAIVRLAASKNMNVPFNEALTLLIISRERLTHSVRRQL